MSHWWAVRAFSNVTARENVPTIAAHASRMEEPAVLHASVIVDAVKITMRVFMGRRRRRGSNGVIMIRYVCLH